MNESLIQENNNNEEELEAAVNETNLPSQTPQADTPPSYHHFPQTNRHISSSSIHNITELLGSKFWQEANWLDIVCEVLFHVKRRNTTIEFEIYAGVVQFISCMYVLPVIPEQMVNAGYDPDSSYVVTV